MSEGKMRVNAEEKWADPDGSCGGKWYKTPDGTHYLVSANSHDQLVEALEELPIRVFVKDDGAGAFYVDWDDIDAADFKDHANEFCQAMLKGKKALKAIGEGI